MKTGFPVMKTGFPVMKIGFPVTKNNFQLLDIKVNTVKSRAVDWSTIQFWNFMAKGHFT